jgi:D-alanyl-D-alanine carboxypeptidase (penicillin-binding protein 5/6)
MRKSVSFFAILLAFQLNGTELPLTVKAESAILINADTGAILYEKNAHEKLYPASVTKIAACLYAIHIAGDKLDMICTADRDAVVSITDAELKKSNFTLPAYWMRNDTTHIGIKIGEKMSLHDLMRGMMIVSGGDAANVIAHTLAGTNPKFVDNMNAYLVSIGCNETHFLNPNGHHHPDHKTTAYDLAIMTQEAMKNPVFRDIVKSQTFARPKTNKQEATTLLQGNRLVRKGNFYYPKAIGVKTGFTTPAKHCLVAAAKNEDRTLIAVLLKNAEREDMFKDSKMIFEAAFQEQKLYRILVHAGYQKHALKVNGATDIVKTYVKEAASISYYPSEEKQLKCFLTWDQFALPIKKDQRVGEIAIKDESGTIVKRTALYAQDDVDQTFMTKMLANPLYLIIAGIVVLIPLAWFVIRRKKVME